MIHTFSNKVCLVILAMAGMAVSSPAESEASVLLRGLSPGEEEVAEMRELVIKLGADDFLVREAATAKLDACPIIPRNVIEEGLKTGDPEVRSRLEKIMSTGKSQRAGAALDRAMDLIATTKEKGQLAGILMALDNGTPCGNPGIAERAAIATSTPEDRERIESMAAHADLLRRRMAAASCEVLGDDAIPTAARLAKDPHPPVRLRAAITLGNLGEISGARTLAGLLDSDSTIERMRACAALRGLTGQNFGLTPLGDAESRREPIAKWKAWLESKNAALVARAGEPSWRKLFNGRNLTGWSAFAAGKRVAGKQEAWEVRDGILRCLGNGPRGDLRTDEAFDNYILLVSYRAGAVSVDSGIGLMLTPANEKPIKGRNDGGSYLEVQLLPKHTGDLYVIGGFEAKAGGKKIAFSHKRNADPADKPGQWNELRVEVSGGAVAVSVNGTEVNNAEGGPREPGKILIRNEGSAIDFREIVVLELNKDE